MEGNGNFCRIAVSEIHLFKTQNPMKPCKEWERNERQWLRTKQNNKKISKSESCVYHVLKNNSAESKPVGLSWECCGLASSTKLDWNALFVYQQACKSWQRSDQLFKPCWAALWVQLLCLVRGPAENLRVKQIVGLASSCVWEVCRLRYFFLHGRKALPQKDASLCTPFFWRGFLDK